MEIGKSHGTNRISEALIYTAFCCLDKSNGLNLTLQVASLHLLTKVSWVGKFVRVVIWVCEKKKFKPVFPAVIALLEITWISLWQPLSAFSVLCPGNSRENYMDLLATQLSNASFSRKFCVFPLCHSVQFFFFERTWSWINCKPGAPIT